MAVRASVNARDPTPCPTCQVLATGQNEDCEQCMPGVGGSNSVICLLEESAWLAGGLGNCCSGNVSATQQQLDRLLGGGWLLLVMLAVAASS